MPFKPEGYILLRPPSIIGSKRSPRSTNVALSICPSVPLCSKTFLVKCIQPPSISKMYKFFFQFIPEFVLKYYLRAEGPFLLNWSGYVMIFPKSPSAISISRPVLPGLHNKSENDWDLFFAFIRSMHPILIPLWRGIVFLNTQARILILDNPGRIFIRARV